MAKHKPQETPRVRELAPGMWIAETSIGGRTAWQAGPFASEGDAKVAAEKRIAGRRSRG